ncbi:MAG: hypothetical protein AAF182_04350 [Pseudomonadota bacterium]
MNSDGVMDMMSGISELGMIVIAGFLFVFVIVPVFNWLINKIKKK